MLIIYSLMAMYDEKIGRIAISESENNAQLCRYSHESKLKLGNSAALYMTPF